MRFSPLDSSDDFMGEMVSVFVCLLYFPSYDVINDAIMSDADCTPGARGDCYWEWLASALYGFTILPLSSVWFSSSCTCFRTIFTGVKRHTYVDPDYSYTDSEARLIQQHKQRYIDFIEALRTKRLSHLAAVWVLKCDVCTLWNQHAQWSPLFIVKHGLVR